MAIEAVMVGVLITRVGVAVVGAGVGEGLAVGSRTVGLGVLVAVDSTGVEFWVTSVGEVVLSQAGNIKTIIIKQAKSGRINCWRINFSIPCKVKTKGGNIITQRHREANQSGLALLNLMRLWYHLNNLG
jgi:hypothetical protein